MNKQKLKLESNGIHANDEYILFYEEKIEIIEHLLKELEKIIASREYINEKIELNTRQTGCIKRIADIFLDEYEYKGEKIQQAFYELTDFIYYPKFEYKMLSKYEIETIRMLASYIKEKIQSEIYNLKGDYYKGKHKLEKRKQTLSKIYYNLIYDNQIIGKAWILKRCNLFRNAVYFEINKEYREKGHGSVFFNLLKIEISNRDITDIVIKINKKNKIAFKFLERNIENYELRFKWGKKIICLETLSFS